MYLQDDNANCLVFDNLSRRSRSGYCAFSVTINKVVLMTKPAHAYVYPIEGVVRPNWVLSSSFEYMEDEK